MPDKGNRGYNEFERKSGGLEIRKSCDEINLCVATVGIGTQERKRKHKMKLKIMGIKDQDEWGMSRTQELLTKIRAICVEIRAIKRTSQKQCIKTPFKGQDKDSPQTTGRCYSNPPHKEEAQDDKPGCSHTASASLSPSAPPTGNSDTRTCCAGEEASSPATYQSVLPSPSPPHVTPPDSLSPSGYTGGKGALTQQAHGEFIVSSETICLPNTQQVHGEYF